MKAVILAGGLGTRITEESHLKPKPMIEIGDSPILWHILKSYSHYGVEDFIICAGYKQYVIKEYFADYYLHRSDITFDFTMDGAISIHSNVAEPWKVTIVDTGLSAMTGARIKRIKKYIGNDDIFMLTYGDGVCDVDITKLIEFHKSHGKLATMTVVNSPQRFGVMEIEKNGLVSDFREKASSDDHLINGGFFVLNRKVFDYIDDNEQTRFELAPLEDLAKDSQLMAYHHNGFWQCMDTLRDKQMLDELINKGMAPWIKW